jgi:hypothetical protein
MGGQVTNGILSDFGTRAAQTRHRPGNLTAPLTRMCLLLRDAEPKGHAMPTKKITRKQIENTVTPLLMRPGKAIKFLGVGKNKLLALWKSGAIKAKLLDGRRYFVTESLIAYRDQLRDA